MSRAEIASAFYKLKKKSMAHAINPFASGHKVVTSWTQTHPYTMQQRPCEKEESYKLLRTSVQLGC